MTEFVFPFPAETETEAVVVEPEPMLVIATINLPDGFRAGTMRWVNPDAAYVKDALAASFIVAVT